ncbi:hypothetical protein SAMN05216582_11818 [Selenomonas ruminantium]|uniref:Serine aminopeptidase S33 domain-containing protein n=1 Tax=Selenomonas ruminantium TaxID=971 RepID=A0A1M6VE20_SELRU|nr:alpha/beta fold hydrolase [Selenomonas ruminantium]SHK79720.1 hypothetical protein SAMN05216582_11818 [Selenomonas ruminantium]
MKLFQLRKLITASLLTMGLMTIGTGVSLAQSKDLSIQGDHGKLSAILQTPDGAKDYPLVIVCHGFTSNKDTELIHTLANNLEKNGIASLRFDFNGHGKSEGLFQDMTVLNEIEDAKKVYDYAAKLPHVTSISLAGHSQGGVVASMTAGILGTEKVKSLALMAPAAVLRDDAIRGICMNAHYDANNLPETIPLYNNLQLGKNYVLTAQTLPIYETAVRYQGPAFMIHGTGDVIVPYTYSQRYHRIYFNGQLKLVPGEDHGFTHDIKGACQAVTDYFVTQLKK